MPFFIIGRNSAGDTSSTCDTASDALNKVLELEQDEFPITVEDDQRRTISLDELSAICEADQDRALEVI
jgi:hypothetical protein